MPSAIQLVLEICGIGAGTGQPMVNIEAGIVDVSNGSLYIEAGIVDVSNGHYTKKLV